jgi:hypothetical protein
VKSAAGHYTAYAICTGAGSAESPEGSEKEEAEKEAAEQKEAADAKSAG